MGDQELSAPPPPPPPNSADMTADQKLYVLNALQVVGDWSVHDDGDGRLFYYDHKADASQWEVPDALSSLETEFMMKLMLQNAVATSGLWTAHDTGNGTLYYFKSKTRESVWERPGEWGEMEAAAAEERDRQRIAELAKSLKEEKEQKIKEEKAAKKEKRKLKKQKEKRDKAALEDTKKNEPRQEDIEEEVPLTAEEMQAEEERKAREMKRIEQFRAMLRDKNIMPFCKWSVALPQIAGDPRFMGIPTMDERRAIFEHFVEHRREDIKAEKKSKLKQAKKLFTELLREQFQLDSWEPSTTLSVFLSTLENNLDSQRYKQVQDDALMLLPLSTQEKIYAKAVEEHKSEELKRDGEQLRLTKFLEDKLASHDKTAIAWGDDDVQNLVREFYTSTSSKSTPLLSEQKQRHIFEELVARSNPSRASNGEESNHKQRERSTSRRRSSPQRRSRSNEHQHRESNPRHPSRHSRSHRRRSRSHSRRRRSRRDSRSLSQERSHRKRSGRRRSVSSSRSRSHSREERSSGRSSRRHRHRSSSSSRSRSQTRR